MKIKKPFYLVLISIITSCSTDDTGQDLNISDLSLTITNIKRTSARIEYSGNVNGEIKKILYRESKANEDYQSLSIESGQSVLNGLTGATEYEVKLQVSNGTSNIQSGPYYFVTKSVAFDYARFYSDYSWYNSDFYSPFEFFSHPNRNHVIHAEGLNEFNDIKVYLVNEQRTDSLELAATVVSDSLSFTIPSDYLAQNPRESVKKAYLGVKIKDTYQYLLNEYTWINLSQNPNFTTDEPNLEFKIFNDRPYIDDVTISTGASPNCPNYSSIYFLGDFFGFWEDYYWTPSQADLVIFDSSGNMFNSYTFAYGSFSNECDNFGVLVSGISLLQDGLLLYHQSNVAQVKISNLPSGNYSAKIIFTFDNVQNGIETNTIEFLKE